MQNMTETCLNELLNFNPSYVNTPNMMYKMFLEAKSVQTIKKYNNIVRFKFLYACYNKYQFICLHDHRLVKCF